jgi:hypothetical protein
VVVVAVTLAASLFSASACAVPRACAGGIFTETTRAASLNSTAPPQVRRQRRVEVDFARVGSSAERIALNLFPDVCVIAQRERATDVGRGQVQWEGRVPGAQPGTATLVIDGAIMVGLIRIGADVYEIRYLGEGVHVVTDVDPSKLPRD